MPISAVDTNCHAHALEDAWDSFLVRDDALLCLATAGREGEVRNDSRGFHWRRVISCSGYRAAMEWSVRKATETQRRPTLLQTAGGHFQNETFPMRAMPHSKCPWRGWVEWTLLDGNDGETSAWPNHLRWALLYSVLTQNFSPKYPEASVRISPDLNHFLAALFHVWLRGFFGSFSNHAWSVWKSMLKDVLIPRAGMCCQFSCEDPEFTFQKPSLSWADKAFGFSFFF